MDIRKGLKLFISILCMVICMMPVNAEGYSVLPDITKECSLSVADLPDDAVINVYKAADMNENVQFTLDPAFGSVSVDDLTTDEDFQKLAVTLKNQLPSDYAPVIKDFAAKKDVEQVLSTNLSAGLYLVLITSWEYDFDPYLIAVPGFNKDTQEWTYDVVMHAIKYARHATHRHYRVYKTWTGFEKSEKWPVAIQIKKNGEVFQEVTLDDSNDWKYAWDDDDSGNTYTVAEKDSGKEYTLETTESEFDVTKVFHLNNTKPGKPDGPGTGVKGNDGLWIWMLAMAGVLCVLFGLKKRNKKA